MAPSRKQILENIAKLPPNLQAAALKVLRKEERYPEDPHSKGGGDALPIQHQSSTSPPPPTSYLCQYLELASRSALRDMARNGRWVRLPPEALEVLRRRLGPEPHGGPEHATHTTD